ncbi:hypothetical protein KY284_008053 [Solanum tuberosum]|nr:hypothetical protein KY284_008053 [Solanum tuberosum]
MDALNFPNPQMGVNVNYKLMNWWIDIKRPRKRDPALLEFWDLVRMVFKFIIEEISGFIDLPYHECEMLVPYKPSAREFLKSLGMKSNPTLPSLDLGWIHFDFLYSRFGREDSYYSFSDEFECSIEEWETYHLNAFVISLLGSLVFPKIRGSIDRGLGYVAIEHFYLWSDVVDIFLGYGSKIDNHPRRMIAFTARVGFVDWQIFLIELESGRIIWKFHWLSTPHAIVRGDDRYFIELIGLKGVQPYVPFRTIVYHTRSNDAFPSLPNENCKGKRKATNEKVMSKTIKKKHPSDELVSSLEKKIRELEEEVSDMRGWARLLLSINPTLEINLDKSHVTSQATIQDNPPPTHPTSQNQSSSIQMPPKNIHFPNYPYPPQHHAYASRPPYLTASLPSPPLQAPQYQTPLHQVPWYCAPLIPYQIPSYQMPPYQKRSPVHNIKTLT